MCVSTWLIRFFTLSCVCRHDSFVLCIRSKHKICLATVVHIRTWIQESQALRSHVNYSSFRQIRHSIFIHAPDWLALLHTTTNTRVWLHWASFPEVSWESEHPCPFPAVSMPSETRRGCRRVVPNPVPRGFPCLWTRAVQREFSTPLSLPVRQV